MDRNQPYSQEPEAQSIRAYLRDIAKYKPLTREKEKELAKLKNHNPVARRTLINHNLRFVVSVAYKKYISYGKQVPLLDLIDEGNIGLIKGVKRYNVNRKPPVKLISYAVWWIRQNIEKFIVENIKSSKIPNNQFTNLIKYVKIKDDFYTQNERIPTVEEICKELKEKSGAKVDEIDLMILEAYSHDALSLDQPLTNNEEGAGSSLVEMIAGDNEKDVEYGIEQKMLLKQVNSELSILTKREQKVLKMYYGVEEEREYTLEEIGAKMKLTRERIRQIKERSFKKLKRNSHRSVLAKKVNEKHR